MNCRGVRELSSEYIDRRLPSVEVIRLERHLRGCPTCRQEVEALRRTVSWIASLGELKAPPGFLGRVYEKIDKRERASRPWGWLFDPWKSKVPIRITVLSLLSELTKLKLLPAPFRKLQPAPDRTGGEGLPKTGEAAGKLAAENGDVTSFTSGRVSPVLSKRAR
jgi:anti-sigma factor RsiW